MSTVSSDILSDTIYKYLNIPISTTSWGFWLLILLFVFFLLWLFFGRGDYEYIGLSPMKIGVDSTKYINGHTYAAVEKSNREAEKITGNDIEQLDIESHILDKNSNIFEASNTNNINSNVITNTFSMQITILNHINKSHSTDIIYKIV